MVAINLVCVIKNVPLVTLLVFTQTQKEPTMVLSPQQNQNVKAIWDEVGRHAGDWCRWPGEDIPELPHHQDPLPPLWPGPWYQLSACLVSLQLNELQADTA